MLKWTEEQKQVIHYRQERELLVSAAAGSGKTTVMSGRIIERCLKDGLDPSQLIVLTFTDKAAANMQKSLAKNLRQSQEESKDPEERARLAEIAGNLGLAQVSTIHSFCLRLISEHKHLLLNAEGELLYPDKLITLDADAANLLLEDAVEEALADLYAIFYTEEGLAPESKEQAEALDALLPRGLSSLNPHAWHQALIAIQEPAGKKKSDDYFRKEQLIPDYQYLRSLPDYQDWLVQSYVALVEASQDFGASPACAYFLSRRPESLGFQGPPTLSAAVDRAAEKILELENHPYFAKLLDSDTKESQDLQAQFSCVKRFVQSYLSAIPAEREVSDLPAEARRELWDLAVESGRSLQGTGILSSRGKDESKHDFRRLFYTAFTPLMQLLGAGLTKGNALLVELGVNSYEAITYLRSDEIEALQPQMLDEMAVYLELLLLVDSKYREAKLRRQQIDFSDYEHLALALVRQPEVQAGLAVTYKEVLIDEYQDTNPLQEEILQALGLERISMLGDIKQSIYAFRHADPSIFNHKQEVSFNCTKTAAQTAAEDQGQALILLNKNFRSRPQVLEVINDIFRAFLRKETGQIDYNDDHALVAGRSEKDFFPDGQEKRGDGPVLRLKYTEASKDQGLEALAAWEAMKMDASSTNWSQLTARQLSLLAALKELSDIGYAESDIAILARTAALCEEAQVALEAAQITVSGKREKEFFASPERRLLKALVEVLANSQQDIPLVAVLRSELLGPVFTESELWTIAHGSAADEKASADTAPKLNFYKKLFRFATEGEPVELREKAQAFLASLAEYRRMATYLSLDQLLTRIIEDSPWLDSLAALPFGHDRLSEVADLIQIAASYSKNLAPSFTDFACYLAELEQKQATLKDSLEYPLNSLGVKVLTMHGSKGLEFPVVIYYAPEHKYRNDSISNTRQFSAQLGIAANLPTRGGYLVSPRRLYFQAEQDFSSRAEDYRLLYVTLTRAEELIYLVGGEKDALAKLATVAKRAEQGSKKVDGYERLATQTLFAIKSDMQLIYSWLALSFPDLAGLDQDHLPYAVQDKLKSVDICSYEARLTQVAGDWQSPTATFPEESGEQLAVSTKVDYSLGAKSAAELRDLLDSGLPGDEKLGLVSKLTVSELQRAASRELEETDQSADGASLPGLQEMALSLRDPEFPGMEPAARGAAESGLSASQYGTLLHFIFQQLVLESYYLSEPPDSFSLRSDAYEHYRDFISELLARGALRLEDHRAALQAYPYIESFLQSDLAHRLLRAGRSGSYVARELPFTLSLPVKELPAEENENYLVQGMIDLFFDEGDKSVIVDYKSDYLSPDELAQTESILRERYLNQLNYYAEAVSRLRQKQVNELYIWLIRESRAVRLPRVDVSEMGSRGLLNFSEQK
ncbi:MAG: UvrD-helicase domain-containing protein [Eubacteriales bacterium]|nr:UvrD-helicase domain-containing protein [Eubacteriales bacterium]